MRRLPALLATIATAFPLAAWAAAPPAGPVQHYVVFFKEWSAALDSAAQAVLKTAATEAQAHPQAPVRVIGFADTTGSSQANIDISLTRAQVVADALMAAGVAPQRIALAARGRTNFDMTSQESRRVEIDIRE